WVKALGDPEPIREIRQRMVPLAEGAVLGDIPALIPPAALSSSKWPTPTSPGSRFPKSWSYGFQEPPLPATPSSYLPCLPTRSSSSLFPPGDLHPRVRIVVCAG